MADLWLIRHGETEWSRVGRHTGTTDLPLTVDGERAARGLRARLADHRFAAVLTSPRSRARETCRLAGLSDTAITDDDLKEWDYGAYEGLTLDEIHAQAPDWTIWDGCVPGGEAGEEVAGRARRVLLRATGLAGDVAVFSHGHFLRVLAATWLELRPRDGRYFALDPASVSVLGHEHGCAVVRRWNT
jgi:broad specificity phosphatase PhoE